MKFYVLLLMLLSNVVLGVCSKGELIDLRKIQPAAMDQLAIKDQGKYGICYSYAATFLLDYHRFKKGVVDGNLSPFDAAVTSSIFTDDSDFEGGNICDVVKGLQQKGHGCLDKEIGKDDRFKTIGIDVMSILITNVFSSPDNFIGLVTKDKFIKRSKLTSKERKFFEAYDLSYQKIKDLISTRLGSNFVPTPWALYDLTQKTESNVTWGKYHGEVVTLLTSKACVRKVMLPDVRCESFEDRPINLLARIDREIASRRAVGIHYCAKVLGQPSAMGVDGGGKPIRNYCDPHASVIIGRRMNPNGSCSYLIRNSWGKSYSKYRHPVDQGDVWISEKSLENNLFGVSTVK